LNFDLLPEYQFQDGFDDTPLLVTNTNYPWYRKWILLSMFCCLAFLQESVFVAWNPIGNSALVVNETKKLKSSWLVAILLSLGIQS